MMSGEHQYKRENLYIPFSVLIMVNYLGSHSVHETKMEIPFTVKNAEYIIL